MNTIFTPSNLVDTTYLDRLLLDEKGRLKLFSAEEVLRVPNPQLRIWLQRTGRYSLPTMERIAFLKKAIGERSALEVAAGNGDLGSLLGIGMSDSYMQQQLVMQAYYASLGCAPTNPPPDVERLEAEAAIEKYRPEVVVASWLTQKYQDGDEGPPAIGSSIFGPDEAKIIGACRTYIHIGNQDTHRDKRAFALPYVKYEGMPWLLSRARRPEKNAIWIWGPHNTPE